MRHRFDQRHRKALEARRHHEDVRSVIPVTDVPDSPRQVYSVLEPELADHRLQPPALVSFTHNRQIPVTILSSELPEAWQEEVETFLGV
jgi:hypothetical protein